jgi:hypothetical protein
LSSAAYGDLMQESTDSLTPTEVQANQGRRHSTAQVIAAAVLSGVIGASAATGATLMFGLKGPAGTPGQVGLQGPQGVPGPQGIPGTSAIDLWPTGCKNSFGLGRPSLERITVPDQFSPTGTTYDVVTCG